MKFHILGKFQEFRERFRLIYCVFLKYLVIKLLRVTSISRETLKISDFKISRSLYEISTEFRTPRITFEGYAS